MQGDTKGSFTDKGFTLKTANESKIMWKRLGSFIFPQVQYETLGGKAVRPLNSAHTFIIALALIFNYSYHVCCT